MTWYITLVPTFNLPLLQWFWGQLCDRVLPSVPNSRVLLVTNSRTPVDTRLWVDKQVERGEGKVITLHAMGSTHGAGLTKALYYLHDGVIWSWHYDITIKRCPYALFNDALSLPGVTLAGYSQGWRTMDVCTAYKVKPLRDAGLDFGQRERVLPEHFKFLPPHVHWRNRLFFDTGEYIDWYFRRQDKVIDLKLEPDYIIHYWGGCKEHSYGIPVQEG